MVTHYRIDHRVIHGQTTSFLLKEIPCDGILIVDNDLAADAFMTSIFKGAVPGRIKTLVFSIDKALVKLPEAEASAKNYFVVFKHPTALYEMVQRGYRPQGPVFLGPQQGRAGTRVVLDQLCMTPQEMREVSELEKAGVDMRIQPKLTQRPRKWEEVASTE